MRRGPGNPIPPESRRLVEEREKGRCLRCGGRGYEWHHRRKRSIRDEHQHCPANGVLLCRTDHVWCHSHPIEAKVEGFIVSQFESDPDTIPVDSWFGRVMLPCDGTYWFS